MDAFASLLGSAAEAASMWRRDETTRPALWRNKHLIAATCPCGRSIRATASTLALAPITCQACDGNFQPKTA
jgi:hypothetical protein